MSGEVGAGGEGSTVERSEPWSNEQSKEDANVSPTGGADTGGEGDTIIGKREAGGANKAA